MIRHRYTWPGVHTWTLTGKHAAAWIIGWLIIGTLVDAAGVLTGYFAFKSGHHIVGGVLMGLGVAFLLWIEAALWRGLKRGQGDGD